MPISIATYFKKLQQKLKFQKIGSHQLETEAIMKFGLNKNKTQLYSDFKTLLTQKQIAKLNKLAARRIQKREPLDYILRKTNFWGRDFFCSTPVLIPRIESEILVEAAIKLIIAKKIKNVVELCCGSGVLAISLACEQKLNILAVDICPKAIALSHSNLKLQKEELSKMNSKIDFRSKDILSSDFTLVENIELIIANPPYLTTQEMQNVQAEIKNWESPIALNGGRQGLDFYIHFAKNLPTKTSWLILEHGWKQQQQIIDIFLKQNWLLYSKIKDLGNKDRILIFQTQQAPL